MINVFKKVLMATACVLFIATVSAQDKSAEESNAPVKEGFVFTGWNGSPATMPAQNVVINGSLVAANAEQPTQSELLAKK